MKYKVLSFDVEKRYHILNSKETNDVYVDLFVCGDLGHDIAPESLIGKTVEISSLISYRALASDVKIIE